MSCYYIIGIRLDHRTANASKLQEALTAHGCNIRTVSYTHLPCYKHRYMFVALFCLSRAVFFKNRK